MENADLVLTIIGRVSSPLKTREECPRQGFENAPEAEIILGSAFEEAADGLEPGREILVFTWLHQADRSILKVRPRRNPDAQLKGVFATRSPVRPNPIGLHRVKLLEKDGGRLLVAPLEAVDGTPVIDIKPLIIMNDER